jgi:hypothetical protein
MINIIYICVFMLILKYVYMLKNLNIYLRLDLGNIYILFIIYQFQKILIHFSQVKSVYIYIDEHILIYIYGVCSELLNKFSLEHKLTHFTLSKIQLPYCLFLTLLDPLKSPIKRGSSKAFNVQHSFFFSNLSYF